MSFEKETAKASEQLRQALTLVCPQCGVKAEIQTSDLDTRLERDGDRYILHVETRRKYALIHELDDRHTIMEGPCR